MTKSVHAKEAVETFLNGMCDLDQLVNWAYEFGDDPVDRLDKWSSSVAGLIFELVREMNDGFRTIDEFRETLRNEVTAPAARG
jgi:hypothetical protein